METRRINIKMPADEARELKAISAWDDKTVQQTGLQAIRDWIRKQKAVAKELTQEGV